MSEQGFIRCISHTEEPSADLLGSKAANLIRLSKMGMNVPDGFVIDTQAFDYIVQKTGWGELISKQLMNASQMNADKLSEAARKIHTKILGSELPENVKQEVSQFLKDLRNDKLVVRSSATAEDLPHASFAGQYDTFLNLEGEHEVLKHIIRCYASLWTPRAVNYRRSLEIPDDKIKLAVIVQKQVDAMSAGVLFTKDPVSPFHDYAVIESTSGLGEGVVSGEVTPDRFYLSPESEGRRTKYSVTRKDLSPQLASQKPSEEAGGSYAASISDAQAKRIAEIGNEIECEFGMHQDVEWAIDEQGAIHILQTRPITTLAIAEDETYWTRGYADDYWNDNVTPLFFDLLGDQLTHVVNNELNAIMGYQQMSADLLRLHKAHAYFNLDVLKRKVINEIPPFIRTEDVLNYFPEGKGFYGKETMKELPFNLKTRLMAEIRVMLFDGSGSMTKTADKYQEWNDEVFVPFCQEYDRQLIELCKEGTDEELMELADKLDKVMMDHFRLVRYGIPVHNIGMNLMSNYLLTRFLGKEKAAEAYPILISGLDHKTSETNAAMHNLAESASKKPSVREVILQDDSDAILSHLRKMPEREAASFLSEFNEFIEEYGVRGFTREPFYPRWKEEPSLVFNVMKSLLEGESDISMRNREEVLEQRSAKQREVEEAIKEQRFGGIKWMLFSTILGFARRYICFREDQRFNLDRWITRNRELFIELGHRFEEKGILNHASDIFFLRRREIRRIVNGEVDADSIRQLSSVVEKRRHDFEENEDTTPPKFLVGDNEYDDMTKETDGKLQGIPASQGRVTGTIRVLNSIHEISNVRSGDILVVPKTDPGWTPVFAKIGGLITETGGILSHGAVVSREYAIPAITNIRNACEIFQTGQKVSLDGTKGQIEIL